MKVNKRYLLLRILALPFFICMILIWMSYHAIIHCKRWIMYGGEIIMLEKGDIAILYTASDLVKLGNYLLSPERKVTHEENRGVVTDADLEWLELNK